MSDINEKNENITLIKKAHEAKENSYSPYSKFRVGAALITSENKIYSGANIENSSYGAAICAERTAVVKAVSDGSKHIRKIAVVSDSGSVTYPCGICLQVLSEFMDNGEIILEDENKNIHVYNLSEFLPKAFKL